MDDETTTRRYSTIDDVVEQAILPLLDGGDGEYDAMAIARETHSYMVDTDKRGNELLNTAGFEQTVSDDEFWNAVARNERRNSA